MAAEPVSAHPEPEWAEPAPTSDERSTALMCHLGGYFTSFLLPLLLWLTRKDRSRFVDLHGREALNFQISLIIYLVGVTVISLTLMFVLAALGDWRLAVVIGGVFYCLVGLGFGVFGTITVILASIAASKGKLYRYPMSIRLV